MRRPLDNISTSEDEDVLESRVLLVAQHVSIDVVSTIPGSGAVRVT